VGAGLLAVALDLLAPTLVAGARDPAALLNGEAVGAALLRLHLSLIIGDGVAAAAVVGAVLVVVPGQGLQVLVV
jgi:hypothetical protein